MYGTQSLSIEKESLGTNRGQFETGLTVKDTGWGSSIYDSSLKEEISTYESLMIYLYHDSQI